MYDHLEQADVWLNSEPLTAEGLSGHVVAVDFWTYSCVNWLRTLPYVRAWAEKYADRGLVMVGAHSPEFGFEQHLDNVRRAVTDLGVAYPVAIDNDFAIWQSFGNRYWPALYLLDGDGILRFHHFGEEAYDEIERAIQALLGADDGLVEVEAYGLSAAANWGSLGSPETYVGSLRGDGRSDLRAEELSLNQWALGGHWIVDEQSAVLAAAPGSIAFRFEGRDLNLVMTAEDAPGPVPFTVRLDGQPPGEDRGVDVDEAGGGEVSEPRMYQLVRQSGPVRQRTFEIEFRDSGVRAYVFTFG